MTAYLPAQLYKIESGNSMPGIALSLLAGACDCTLVSRDELQREIRGLIGQPDKLS
jgi:hypothetical protein